MDALQAAQNLYRLRKSNGVPMADGTHWLISPEAWMQMRQLANASVPVRITGNTTQEFMGIPVRIGLEGSVPAVDLVEPSPPIP